MRKSNLESQDLCLRVPLAGWLAGSGAGGAGGGGGGVSAAQARVSTGQSDVFLQQSSFLGFLLQLAVRMESWRGVVTQVHVTRTLSAALWDLRFTGIEHMNHVRLYEMICLHIW